MASLFEIEENLVRKALTPDELSAHTLTHSGGKCASDFSPAPKKPPHFFPGI
jgi:hypothetical protein